jgi:transcriptional regulator with XRE-family HTH domain
MNFKPDKLFVMDMNNFSEWLRQQMKDADDMSQAELSRRSGLSPSQVSKLLSMQSPPGKVALLAIADAFHLKKETVFRAAGILPEEPRNDELLEQLTQLASHLNDDDKGELIQLAEYKTRKKAARGKIDELGERIDEVSANPSLSANQKREEMFRLFEEWLTSVGGKRIK